MTSDGLRLLEDVRRSLLDPPAQLRPRTVTTSQAEGARQECKEACPVLVTAQV